MKYLTIDDIKQQLRLDFDCEDALLELYGQGAEDTVLYLCNRTYENLVGTYGEVPAAIRQATLELVTNSYEQRSPASPTNLSAVPYNFDLLIKPYMLLHGTPLKNERNRIIDSLHRGAYRGEVAQVCDRLRANAHHPRKHAPGGEDTGRRGEGVSGITKRVSVWDIRQEY
jgi:uncharacterized phage protein (predicted DNA packaging)